MGPCMCGDPYCASCGDPSLALYEEAEEQLLEKLAGLKADLRFYHALIDSLPYLHTLFKLMNGNRDTTES